MRFLRHRILQATRVLMPESHYHAQPRTVIRRHELQRCVMHFGDPFDDGQPQTAAVARCAYGAIKSLR